MPYDTDGIFGFAETREKSIEKFKIQMLSLLDSRQLSTERPHISERILTQESTFRLIYLELTIDDLLQA